MNLSKFSTKDYKKIQEGLLEIGDVVITINSMGGTHIYEIDGVTKTLGKCKCQNFVQRFRRNIGTIHSIPHDTWDTNNYTVYRKES